MHSMVLAIWHPKKGGEKEKERKEETKNKLCREEKDSVREKRETNWSGGNIQHATVLWVHVTTFMFKPTLCINVQD